jgi:hypothetical protein
MQGGNGGCASRAAESYRIEALAHFTPRSDSSCSLAAILSTGYIVENSSNLGTAAHLAIFCLYRLPRVKVALVVSREEFESEPMW